MSNWEDLDCSVCGELFYEPLALFCGHTFCRHCLIRSLDHTASCPLCRTVIHIDASSAPVCTVLQAIIEKVFPERYEERKEAIEKEKSEEKFHLPLFVLSSSGFPGQIVPMHIFEPRYRLMMRRALQGSRNFGLIGVGADRAPRDYGVVLHITHSEMLPDGRSIILTKATKRFHVKNKWELDGYMMGEVEYLHDQPITEEQVELCKELYQNLETKYAELVRTRVIQAREHEELSQRKPSITQSTIQVNNSAALEEYSYWLASALPLTSNLQFYLLKTNDTHERLKTLDHLFSQGLQTDSCAMPPASSA